MKWKRTKKGGKGERKEGEEGDEGKQELDEEDGEDEEDNIQVDSPGPDMDDLNSSSSVVNMQCSSSPPQFEIKSETPEHHIPTPALNPFYLPGKLNPASFTSFPSSPSFAPSFPSSPFPNHQLGLKPRDLREAFGLARRPDPEVEVAESR